MFEFVSYLSFSPFIRVCVCVCVRKLCVNVSVSESMCVSLYLCVYM